MILCDSNRLWHYTDLFLVYFNCLEALIDEFALHSVSHFDSQTYSALTNFFCNRFSGFDRRRSIFLFSHWNLEATKRSYTVTFALRLFEGMRYCYCSSGYGNIAPQTFWGRLVCISYALVGIPIMLLCLANLGELMANIFRFTYSKVCCCGCCRCCNKRSKNTSSHYC